MSSSEPARKPDPAGRPGPVGAERRLSPAGRAGKDSLDRYRRVRQVREVGVFLFLIVPSLSLSFFADGRASQNFPFLAFTLILRDLSLLSLVLYFLWRNNEAIASIGLKFTNAGREVLLGAWLYIPLVVGIGLLNKALQAAGLSGPTGQLSSLSAPKSGPEYLLAAVLVAVVAVSEESIFRGYLMLRFRNVLAGPAAAVLASAFVFSLGHGYEGTAGVVTTGAIGLVFALIFLWRRSIVAPVVMHFLQDFLGMVLLPLLGGR